MDLQRLKLAFTCHMLEQVIGADAVVDPAELAHLRATFGPEMLRSCGFKDAEGCWTPSFHEARAVALLELPDRLTHAEKLAVLEVLVDASAADGVLEPSEVDVLVAAARMLGLEGPEWAAHAEALVAAGRMRRAE